MIKRSLLDYSSILITMVLIRSNVTLMFNETSKTAEQNFCEELLFLDLHSNIKHDGSKRGNQSGRQKSKGLIYRAHFMLHHINTLRIMEYTLINFLH